MASFLDRLTAHLRPRSLRDRAADRWITGEAGTPVYRFALAKWRCPTDPLLDPTVLWSPRPYWAAREGLSGHLEQRRDTAAHVPNDLCVILPRECLARARASRLKSWERAAERLLTEAASRWVHEHGARLRVPNRPMRVRIFAETDLAVAAALEPHEFATGVWPNLDFGPQAGERPLVEVFVRGPAGFRAAGTIESGRGAFHLGNHPLDDVCHAELGGPAIVRIELDDDGAWVPVVDPAQVGRVRLDKGRIDGQETLRVVDAALGTTRLELMLVPRIEAGVEIDAETTARGPLPAMAPAAGATVFPEGGMSALGLPPKERATRGKGWDLVEVAVLVRGVRLGGGVRGYTMDIDRSGRVAPRVADPVARLFWESPTLRLQGLAPDLSFDGLPLRAGHRPVLDHRAHGLLWRDGGCRLDGRAPGLAADLPGTGRWPFVVRISAPRRRHCIADGAPTRVGRDRAACSVELPDRPTQDNLLLGPGQRAVEGVRTDAIAVPGRAAEIIVDGRSLTLRNLSERCWPFVLRAGLALRVEQDQPAELRDGDELVIGNQVFALVEAGKEPPPDELRAEDPEPATVVEAPPPPRGHRNEGAPGGKGRRPTAGGRSGQLVELSRSAGHRLRALPLADSPRTRLDAEDAPPAVASAAHGVEGARGIVDSESPRDRTSVPPHDPAGLRTADLPSISLDAEPIGARAPSPRGLRLDDRAPPTWLRRGRIPTFGPAPSRGPISRG